MRKGMGKGLGMGYKNIAPMDSHIHSLSARGLKLTEMIYDNQGKNVWVRAKGKEGHCQRCGMTQPLSGRYCSVCGSGNITDVRDVKLDARMFTMYGSKWKIVRKGKDTVVLRNRKGETLTITRDEYEQYKPQTRPTGDVIEEVISAKGKPSWEYFETTSGDKELLNFDSYNKSYQVEVFEGGNTKIFDNVKGKYVYEGRMWNEKLVELGVPKSLVEKSLGMKFDAKGSVVTPKQPKTVYHKGIYSNKGKPKDDLEDLNMRLRIAKTKQEINDLLYNVKEYKGEPANDHELMTVTILENKLPHLNFLTAHTDVDATGYWKSKITDVSYDEEKNAIVQIEFLDTKNEKVGKRLVKLFEDLNNSEIGEELLYVRTQPLEETSLPLEEWR